ncbi:MarR family transcriptional regulator [Paenibacillus sp. FSL R7-0198]|uniref:MarR family winged helix-turn-helix transcriptional regulator n=1 Tax=Paenibacillus TaxID=44249 RepID=UPI001059A6A5|nr:MULTISPECIES: MarR family transcriptional regulator [Paenibacillus]MCW3795661.1 MarR family transcriptional regulator [Paenibacillus sp. LS1]TDL64111.1 MarR family transcriptional regulator [Paenibacillus amylolyticus]
MKGKNNREHTTEPLPKLGPEPYVELMQKTATKGTDQKLAYIGLLSLWFGDNILDVMDLNLDQYDITESKFDLLLLLTLHEGNTQVTPSTLAERLGIRRASVTALLDWLEKRNWIIRESSARDRRSVHVRISPEGRDLVEKVLPSFWSTCESLVEDLEPDERDVLEKVLLKLNTNIEKRLGMGR